MHHSHSNDFSFRELKFIKSTPTKSIINTPNLIIIVLLIAFISGLFYQSSFFRHKHAFQINPVTSKAANPSSHWLILSSDTQLQEYLTSPQQNISIIFIGNRETSTQISKKINIIFLNSQLQSQLAFRSTNPKVIAYLLAIKYGARFIYEFDSHISFHHHQQQQQQQQQNIQHIAFRRQRSPFINIHPTFTANFTHFSPGIPKQEHQNISQDGWSSIRLVDHYQETIHPLIQQQIIVYYDNKSSSSLVNHPPVAVEPYSFAPFSNQNLLFSYDAFWGLVLSESTKSDIWRSWWVQRLLWDINGHLIFTSSGHQINMTSTSKNTPHNIKEDENVGELVRYLSSWKSTKQTLVERIEQLTKDLIKQNFYDAEQLKIIKAWLDDLQQINYLFPTIKSTAAQQVTF